MIRRRPVLAMATGVAVGAHVANKNAQQQQMQMQTQAQMAQLQAQTQSAQAEAQAATAAANQAQQAAAQQAAVAQQQQFQAQQAAVAQQQQQLQAQQAAAAQQAAHTAAYQPPVPAAYYPVPAPVSESIPQALGPAILLEVTSPHIVDESSPVMRQHHIISVPQGAVVKLVRGNLTNGLGAPFSDYIEVEYNGKIGKISRLVVRPCSAGELPKSMDDTIIPPAIHAEMT